MSQWKNPWQKCNAFPGMLSLYVCSIFCLLILCKTAALTLEKNELNKLPSHWETKTSSWLCLQKRPNYIFQREEREVVSWSLLKNQIWNLWSFFHTEDRKLRVEAGVIAGCGQAALECLWLRITEIWLCVFMRRYEIRSLGSEWHGLCLNLGFMASWLCEEVSWLLCFSFFSFENWGNSSSIFKELLWE